MNIDFILYPQKKKQCFRLAVRVRYNKLDFSKVLNIFVEKESDWDSVRQQFADSPIVNQRLAELKSIILKSFNESYVSKEFINSEWLGQLVQKTFERPNQEQTIEQREKNVYLSSFAKFWVENRAKDYRVSRTKTMSLQSQKAYKHLYELISEYEESELKRKLVLANLTIHEIYDFVAWLEEQEYSNSTIGKYVDRLKFILNRAYDEQLEVSQVRTQRVYIESSEDIDGISLSENEIQKIIDKDFSFDPILQLTKDNFIIGIFTGMRSSDFIERLNASNLKDGYIELRTQKTKTKVVLPVHPEIEKVISRYWGNFPPKQSNLDFNKKLKVICQLCEINEQTEGKLFDKEKHRKVFGIYPKYKLITTHTLRRSFVTIYKEHLDKKTLCDILGWSSSAMLQIYDMTTKKESADKLKKIWETKKV